MTIEEKLYGGDFKRCMSCQTLRRPDRLSFAPQGGAVCADGCLVDENGLSSDGRVWTVAWTAADAIAAHKRSQRPSTAKVSRTHRRRKG